MPPHKFELGDKVDKVKGYGFPSTVVSVFWTTNGDLRYVCEMDNYRLLHIFNEEQLKPKEFLCWKPENDIN